MRWLVLATLLVVCGCGTKNIAGGDPNAATVNLNVLLKNLDAPIVGDNIHILDPNEDFAPSNRLAPGESRVTLVRARHNEEVLFRAGRNGDVLASKKCKCTSACPTSGSQVGSPRVEWNGSALACVAW